MKTALSCIFALALISLPQVRAAAPSSVASGWLLAEQPVDATLWWAGSAAAKIRPDQAPPVETGARILARAARNEVDAAQLIVRPRRTLEGLRLACGGFEGVDGARLPASCVELLRVQYLEIVQPTDRHSVAGAWPDPLLPIDGALNLEPGRNHSFWIRVSIPRDAPAGEYHGTLRLRAADFAVDVPLQLTVYGFTLPDRMTCTTAFGFSPGEVFRYQRLETEAQKRQVLELYLANLAAHHISPYDPAPLDHFTVKWPDVRPPPTVWDQWANLRIVGNEVHRGKGALLIYDDKADENVTVTYQPAVPIPPKGLRIRAWYRTAVPGHRFLVSLNHYDADQQWMSGRNNDILLQGSGQWQNVDELITDFPAGAKSVRFHLRATPWTDTGEHVGLVWFDDLSATDPDTGEEFIAGGDFEPENRLEPIVPPEQLQVTLDFTRWDRAMTRALDLHHFNAYRLGIPGIGGGTFHAIEPPSLLGFGEDTPEYPILFDSYCRQLEAHLQDKGWLDQAFIYWFDEPSADQYPFVMNGFRKLKRACPGIARMLTEQVEPGLIGGPNVWCSISNQYDHQRAEARRAHGEKFWWYVCTGPKAPYTGLFIDHPAPELRLWLWQTWQRNIEGVLIWQCNYWTSSAAYPDRQSPQNPYADPMSWTSGYSTPAGERRPWGNGDGRFIYPPPEAADAHPPGPVIKGPVDSIRWEHLRDGLEDYEYLCILRQRLEQNKNRLAAELHARYAELLRVPEAITRSLTQFAADGVVIENQRHHIAQAIDALAPE